jgi:hypothetical protein
MTILIAIIAIIFAQKFLGWGSWAWFILILTGLLELVLKVWVESIKK